MRCPECSDELKSLARLKRHMSNWHGGYTDAQIAQATGIAPSTSSPDRMKGYAASLPETAAGIGTEKGKEGSTPESTAAAPAPAPEPAKRVKVTPRKLRKLIATMPGEWFKAHGIELDSEDQEAVEEAIEFLENVFGFEFAVPAEKYIIKSRIWAMLWPIGVFLFIFVKHKAGDIFKQAEQQVEEHHNGTYSTPGERQEL